MKNVLRVIFVAMFGCIAMVSCKKDETYKTDNGNVNVNIIGQICEPSIVGETKASASTVIMLGWTGGETVYAYAGNTKVGELTAKLYKSDKQYATLTGTLENVPVGTTVITFVHSNKTVNFNDGKATIDLSSQNETLPFVIYGTMEYKGTSMENELVKFNFATSHVLLTGSGIGTTGTPTASIKGVNTVCAITPSATGNPTIVGETADMVTKTAGISASGDGRFTMNVSMAPDALDATTTGRTVVVKMGGKTYESAYTTTKMQQGKTYISVYTLTEFKPKFSVSATEQVIFSPGNLQAVIDASGNPTSWKFADNQWERIGADVANTTIGTTEEPGTAGTVDLFGWSTNGTGASENYKKWGINASTSDNDYKGDFNDWGKAFGEDSKWRTLSSSEWSYLLQTREVNGGKGNGKSYQRATINSDATGVYGMIIYPDGYTKQQATSVTSYTSSEWSEMEAAGCVFLPAAGYRTGSSVKNVGSHGRYWSSTPGGATTANLLIFYSGSVGPWDCYSRICGQSVRLVQDAN